MEGTANGTTSQQRTSVATEDSAEEASEKPPPWEATMFDDTLSREMQELLENEDEAMISREDIENSLKKYEELSRQLDQTKRSLQQYADDGEVYEGRRNSLDEERASTDGEGEDKSTTHSHSHTFDTIGEEERSKSDDDKDDLLMRDISNDATYHEEERSKSDGDKEDVVEEDDEDAVPLRIQAAHKSDKLTLSNCWLKTIPSEVWDLTHLTELDLSANYLKKVSKSIGNLTSLKRLRLNHNQLTILPKEMWTLTKLTTLLLNNNNLKMIPKEIKNLTKLKTLDLSSNQLVELPVKEGILQLPSLSELRLRNNQLTTLPVGMQEMTQLQVLWLEGNPMPVPKSVLKRNASGILSYIKEHPNFAKRPSIDAGNPRVLRKSPPSNTPVVNAHGHVPGKKDFGILAEKELKKRKREQLEEMRKHLEVEKKVKHLEHELMLANAKALKYEEEARKVGDTTPLGSSLDSLTAAAFTTPEPQTPPTQFQFNVQSPPPQQATPVVVSPLPPQQIPQPTSPLPPQHQAGQLAIPAAQPQPMSPIPPSPFPQIQFGVIPPHMPRQQGQPAAHLTPNDYKPYPPLPLPVQQQQQQQQQQNPNQTAAPSAAPPSPNKTPSFEWEIPLMELSFGPRIGRGGYGEVYRGMWGGTEVAVKMLFTDNMNAKLLDDLRKEVDLLCKLRHPNIILFMGACTEPVTPCIVTEYLARGSLAGILMDQSVAMDWGLTLQVGIDTARGMAYLHSRNPVIIHRDLKTDNLLVDDNWQVKVADFGLATVKSRTFAKTMCGTTGWVAPEVLAEQGYTEKADVYSFAIILWELLTRQIPYAGKNTMQVVRSVDRGERLAIPPTCPPDYARLINECWDTDPSVRPPFTAILTTLERMRADFFAQKAALPPTTPAPADATGIPAPQQNGTLPEPNGTAPKPAAQNGTGTEPKPEPMSTSSLSLPSNDPSSTNPSPSAATTTENTSPPPDPHPPPLPDGSPGTHERLIADNSLT